MPVNMANKYVCISHVPGFWDHVIVGTHAPHTTEDMIDHDDYLPKLFDVRLGRYRFHWCCFVLKKQIILAMWCTDARGNGRPRVVPLVDADLRYYTTSPEFRCMAFYLCKWFTAQYTSPARELKVVLDCKPSQGATFVHVIAFLASKIGMTHVTPNVYQVKTTHDLNYHLNLGAANAVFNDPCVSQGDCIYIVDDFTDYHNSRAIAISVPCVHTQRYNYM